MIILCPSRGTVTFQFDPVFSKTNKKKPTKPQKTPKQTKQQQQKKKTQKNFSVHP